MCVGSTLVCAPDAGSPALLPRARLNIVPRLRGPRREPRFQRAAAALAHAAGVRAGRQAAGLAAVQRELDQAVPRGGRIQARACAEKVPSAQGLGMRLQWGGRLG